MSPPPGWRYQHWNYGQYYPRPYWQQQPYWINNYSQYGLQPLPYGYVWVQNGPDALAVNSFTGVILQVIYGLFSGGGGLLEVLSRSPWGSRGFGSDQIPAAGEGASRRFPAGGSLSSGDAAAGSAQLWTIARSVGAGATAAATATCPAQQQLQQRQFQISSSTEAKLQQQGQQRLQQEQQHLMRQQQQQLQQQPQVKLRP